MKCFKSSLIVLICFYYINCNNSNDNYQKKINTVIKLDIPNHFSIVSSEEHQAVGDYLERFEIIFSEKDYKLILCQLDSTKMEKPNEEPHILYLRKTYKINESKTVIFNLKKKTIIYSHAIL
jgi:hypothetical protein